MRRSAGPGRRQVVRAEHRRRTRGARQDPVPRVPPAINRVVPFLDPLAPRLQRIVRHAAQKRLVRRPEVRRSLPPSAWGWSSGCAPTGPQSATLLERSLALNPESAEAHYRLSRAYIRFGRKEEGQQQIALRDSCAKEAKLALDTRTREIVRFVLPPQEPEVR